MTLLSKIELPTPPGVALQLVELLADPDVDLHRVEAVVGADAALAAKFLKTANSSFYGQQREVASLSRAIVVLGTDHVKVVALGFQLAEMSRTFDKLSVPLECVWQGNLLRACLARHLTYHSRRIPSCHAGEAFLIGLLQDMAVPIIALHVPPAYINHLGAGGRCSLADTVEFELGALGESHADVAAGICRLWRFPSRIELAIAQHHQPPPMAPTDELVVTLWQLAYFVGAIPFDEGCQSARVAGDLRRMAERVFHLNQDTLAAAFYQAIDEYEQLAHMFERVLPGDTDAEAILAGAHRLLQNSDR